MEFTQERDAVKRGWLLPRSEHAVKAQMNEVGQGLSRIAAVVE